MFYDFTPFSILGRLLAKVQQDGATGMLVTPLWSTQPGKGLLQLQGKLDVVHPLHSKLALLATVILGQPSKVHAYQ